MANGSLDIVTCYGDLATHLQHGVVRITLCPNMNSKFYFKQELQSVMQHTKSKELRVTRRKELAVTTTNYLVQEERAHSLPGPRVPLKIWDLWDRGVKNAPHLQKTCLMSHRGANPTFTVTQLDMKGVNCTKPNCLSLS